MKFIFSVDLYRYNNLMNRTLYVRLFPIRFSNTTIGNKMYSAECNPFFSLYNYGVIPYLFLCLRWERRRYETRSRDTVCLPPPLPSWHSVEQCFPTRLQQESLNQWRCFYYVYGKNKKTICRSLCTWYVSVVFAQRSSALECLVFPSNRKAVGFPWRNL